MRALAVLLAMAALVVVLGVSTHPLVLGLAAVALLAAGWSLGHPSAGVCQHARSRPGAAVPDEALPAGPVGGGHHARGAHA